MHVAIPGELSHLRPPCMAYCSQNPLSPPSTPTLSSCSRYPERDSQLSSFRPVRQQPGFLEMTVDRRFSRLHAHAHADLSPRPLPADRIQRDKTRNFHDRSVW